MTHPWFGATGTPRVLAHRGFVPPDAEGILENTAAAFAAAHAAGAVYIESDCHLTADGVPVLVHDPDLSRLIGDDLRTVASLTRRELAARFDTRGGLLTLADALDAFPTVRFNIDVKVSAAADAVGRQVAKHADRVLLTSFDDRNRRAAVAAAGIAGGIPATSAGTATIARLLGAVAVRSQRLVRRALAGIDAVQVPEYTTPRRGRVRIVTPRFIDAVHRCGVEVHVWTVNAPADMSRLLDFGVDGLVTDRTDLAVTAVRGRG